ncbi:ATP-binding cassette domain-containing protein [Evansella clarkii]|jgi:ABC-type lipoprotein export system ATPase subunit|uniref:ATP-binding cassette domain-containing protein n=1 Tax=Evansella clarkii TaxID=79879 RepID=UPI0009960047|nr:ATP-binding cassette domain-containing protein [Evansella clarkii]
MGIVSLSNVLKRFSADGEMNILFENMNLQVNEGEVVVITGGSQTGKSTLLHMIAAMTPANKGTVEVFGQNLVTIKERPKWRLENIGLVTDEGCLLPYLTVKQNLLLGTDRSEADYPLKEAQAHRILEGLGFSSESVNETLEGLTSKEQILATIGRIFMTNPKLILADEPGKRLSGPEGEEVIRGMFQFARSNGSTVIAVSNDPGIIKKADRLLRLENRKLVEVQEAAG